MKKVTMKEIRFYGVRNMPIGVLTDEEGNENSGSANEE